MQTVIKVLGIIALVWIGLIVLGLLIKALFWALVIGAVLFAGYVAYLALTGTSDRPAVRE